MKVAAVVVCLAIGIALVAVQVIHELHRSQARDTVAEVAQAASDAAASAAEVIESAGSAVDNLNSVHDRVRATGMVPPEMTAAIGDVTDATRAAKEKTADAKARAGEAASTAASLSGVLGDLSGRLPYAVLGLVFILAGAWIGGLIDLSLVSKS